MYRTGDPRFRRRLNEIGHTLETANESAQSNIYIFAQTYIRPCLESVGNAVTICVDASCPSLNLRQRDRLRRQRGRGRSRGRAELSFDFYDDWDDDENDALMGWGNEEFDRLLAGDRGYGTTTTATTTNQPPRQLGSMKYATGRRKSAVQAHDGGTDPTVIPGSSSFFGKLFGGKALRYKPSAADLQDHPGARRLDRDLTEGEALLADVDGDGRRAHKRQRSNTATSDATIDSYSSRGDILPSDGEDDAVAFDDEFAMVLERRTTQSGGASQLETESSSGKTRKTSERGRGKRPSGSSRTSSKRTFSSRSSQSVRSESGRLSRQNTSSTVQAPVDEDEAGEADEQLVPTLSELKLEEHEVEREEEADIERRREEARRLAAERGLAESNDADDDVDEDKTEVEEAEVKADKVDTPTPAAEEPSQLPTPVPTDDEDDIERPPSRDENIGPEEGHG